MYRRVNSNPNKIQIWVFSKLNKKQNNFQISGGTDIVDQRMGRYSTKTKCNKWPRVVFSYILDTARINSQTICALQKKVDPRQFGKSFEFGIYLAQSLVKPLIESRSLNGLQSRVQMKMSFMLDRPVGRFGGHGGGRAAAVAGAVVQGAAAVAQHAARSMRNFAQKDEKRARCKMCYDELPQGEGHKDAKGNISKVTTRCGSCGEPCCPKHTVVLCIDCSHLFAPIRNP